MSNIEEIPLDNISPLLRALNRELLVAWINADLLNRAANDIRTSHVWYDENKEFLIAAPKGVEITAEAERSLYQYGARYHSIGV